MPCPIKLVVGLGNPGQKYTDTRHNAGFWFTDVMADRLHGSFNTDRKFHGEITRLQLDGVDLRLLKPDTYMNNSGRAVKAAADYFSIDPAEILVAHDEIDLAPGIVRLKRGGGHGGHNGLRDIIEQTGSREFMRLRIGVGHPGHRDDVIQYVLNRPTQEQHQHINEAIVRAMEVMPVLFSNEINKAMTLLNGAKAQDANKKGNNEQNHNRDEGDA